MACGDAVKSARLYALAISGRHDSSLQKEARRTIRSCSRPLSGRSRGSIGPMPFDIEIARATRLKPIAEIAAKIGAPESALRPFGRFIAKLEYDFLRGLANRPDGKLILVTAISPTPAGEGKTTTTIGLGDALNRIGRKTIVCLREPSLGPCFGIKGGATGGGHAQVAPMEEINLHFTGDFHAITSAHNLLAAMIDNHMYWGNPLRLDQRRIAWRRALDMNDRALREIVVGLGAGNGFPREDGFDITVASEVMAAFCLALSPRGSSRSSSAACWWLMPETGGRSRRLTSTRAAP